MENNGIVIEESTTDILIDSSKEYYGLRWATEALEKSKNQGFWSKEAGC